MSRFARDRAALERGLARLPPIRDESAQVREILRRVPLEGNPRRNPGQLALGVPPTYPDGRTVPQLGDEVCAAVPGTFGIAGSMCGTVIKKRDGSLAVRVTESSHLLGGRERLRRARTYPLSEAWTIRGEKGRDARAQDEADRKFAEEQAQWKRDVAERQAALERAQAEARAAGRLLSDARPPAGARVRWLRTGQFATVQKRRDKPLHKWERFDPDAIDVRFDGERYQDYWDEMDGEKFYVQECAHVQDPDEWEVVG